MSVGDRWWDATAPAPADTGSPDAGATAAPAKPTVQDLGNGYSLVQFTDENGLAKSQIVPNKDAASVAAVEAAKIGAGAAGVSASITAGAANQRAAVQAEIDRAKNASDAAHNAALLALQQGNAAEARRQFDISSQELARSHQADEQLRQQAQGLASAKFGNDVYNKLSELASNPRNYMEQFFRFRGQPAPANSAQYGNTSVTGPGLMTLEQFLPNFLKSTGLSAGGPGAATPPTAASPATSFAGGAREGGNMQSDIAQTYSGAGDRARTWAQQIGNDPRSGAIPGSGGSFTTGATVNGQFNPQAGRTVTNPFGAENSGQQYDPAQRQQQNMDFEKQVAAQHGIPNYAHGGSLRMTAPHAIVNLLSGKVAAIAGEQPGRGPHGFVPETAKFDGKAIIDKDPSDYGQTDWGSPIGPQFGGVSSAADSGIPTGTYNPPEPPPAPVPAGPDYGYPGSPAPDSSIPSGAYNPPDAATQARLIAETGAGVTSPSGSAAPSGPDRVNVQAPLIPAIAPMPPLSAAPVTSMPATVGSGTVAPQIPSPGSTDLGSALAPAAPAAAPAPVFTPPPLTTGPSTATPLINPTGSNAWGGPIGTPSVPTFLDNLMQTPSGLGKNPQFLPETSDAITNQMIQSGSFPPFLQRIFAQQKGLAGLGTNVPQQTNLPEGVPLVSSLALTQMSPSELAAFQSFVSAHGMDWNDYLALVKQASPEGGTSNPNPAIPKFLGQ